MSTRGAFGIKVDGLYKIAYNHSDSYLAGLGRDTAEQWLELRDRYGASTLREMGRKLRLVTTSYMIKPAALALARAEWQQIVDTTSKDDWRYKPAADCLDLGKSTTHWRVALNIEDKLTFAFETGYIADNFEFMAESLFCEWAYVVDLDAELYEIYRGFSKAPHRQGPFAGVPLKKKEWASGEAYQPVRQIARLPIAALEDDWCQLIDLAMKVQDEPEYLDDEDVSAHERIEAIAFIDKYPFEEWTGENTAQRARFHMGRGPRKKPD